LTFPSSHPQGHPRNTSDFRIPPRGVTVQPGRSACAQMIGPVLRHAGARLSVANRLYQAVNAGNANERKQHWGKFWR
jgi:hypothetical protein